MRFSRGLQRGFALPTVLIASVVMLTVLAVTVASVAAVRVTLKEQYYEQLAKSAGEAGVAYAKACLAKNGNIPLWTNSKPLTPSTDCAGNQLLEPQVDVLIVAGGGSGGGGWQGGGGGGGGVIQDTIPVSAQNYTMTVGAGGGPGNSITTFNNGGNSSAFGLTAIGGGRGAGEPSGTSTTSSTGGSGGGGSHPQTSSAAGTAGQGNAGGNGRTGNPYNGGGGGGAGGAGQPSTTTSAGDGGSGILSLITGSTVYYGGGGGGSHRGGTAGAGGIGGGGAGGTTGQPGADGLGGGGGAGSNASGASGPSGAGGSGVVIVRYGNNGSIEASGGSESVVGPYRIHRFTTVGNTPFVISTANNSTCPSDPRCSVVTEENLRSSFSVGLPTLDADGKASTIPNTGYVELLRSSNNAVWRTYRQPSTQAAVVPDFCSGSASGSLGWRNAAKSSGQDSIATAPSAVTISESSGNVQAGNMFFRKDFNVTFQDTYYVSIHTPSSDDVLDIYVDDVYRGSTAGSLLTSTAFTLNAGCHTITARLTNKTIRPKISRFTAAVQQNGTGAPVVVSDSSWRVSTGDLVSFSESRYYADPDYWGPVTNQGQHASWTGGQSVHGDSSAAWIITNHSGTSYPLGYSYFRDTRDVTVTQNTEVKVSALCDDNCVIYMDGQPVLTQAPWANIHQQTLTLTPGSHRFGARLYNGGVGGSGLSMTVIETATGAVLTHTDNAWLNANFWETSPTTYSAYDSEFIPAPITNMTAPVRVLAVGGGGGGGGTIAPGGGGGGMVDRTNYPVSVGSYRVTVGAGGGGGVGWDYAPAYGADGGFSRFDKIFALGGGGGAGYARRVSGFGGSGGGGAYQDNAAIPANAGGWNFVGQGNRGGNDVINNSNVSAGGGGAGAVGQNSAATKSGNGGAGLISNITGSNVYYAAGGGGGSRTGSSAGTGGTGGGGNGTTSTVTASAGAANTGSGGGGGGYNTGSTAVIGGAGGSGVVIIAYPAGSITAIGGTITEVNGNTIHRFTSSGTFTVLSVNGSSSGPTANYTGLSGAYAGSNNAQITVGAPLTSGVPTPYYNYDYDLWSCTGSTSCSPAQLYLGQSSNGTLQWEGLAPTGTVTRAMSGTVVRYQLIAYADPIQVSNIVTVVVP